MHDAAADGRPDPARGSRRSRFDWATLLPWHAPERQKATYGWWGWFPSIPRNRFGRICWVILVAAVASGFAVLTVVFLGSFFAELDSEILIWMRPLELLLGLVLFPFGFLLFTWHLLNGIALARKEAAESRSIGREAERAALRAREAKRRLLARPDPRRDSEDTREHSTG